MPGFYKAVTITSPPVIAAIRTLLQRGQPYIGAFLLKDSESDSDVITSVDQVYPVGVFAQITSVFGSGDAGGKAGEEGRGGAGGDKDGKETLTAVLYPHRRIHIDELVRQRPPGLENEAHTAATPDKPESEVASFELESTPSAQEVQHELGADSTSGSVPAAAPASSISFLHTLLPDISLTNVSNLQVEPFQKDSQMIRAVMNELLSVFKDIAQLAPIFREQSGWWRGHGNEESELIVGSSSQSHRSPCPTGAPTSLTSRTASPISPRPSRPAKYKSCRPCSSRSR